MKNYIKYYQKIYAIGFIYIIIHDFKRNKEEQQKQNNFDLLNHENDQRKESMQMNEIDEDSLLKEKIYNNYDEDEKRQLIEEDNL